MKCPICNNNKNNSEIKVKEMQYGLRDEFEYIECSKCGCLFIKDIPEDIGKYYGVNYASHNHNMTIKNKIIDKIYGMYLANNPIIKFIQRDNVGITTKFWNSLSSNDIMRKDSSILDIGCGNGRFLNLLKKGGFKDLTGIDLFIDEENMLKGIKIFKSSLEEFKPGRKYDIIISNHSFEHMDNQLENLRCLENLVKNNGIIVIRMPIKTDFVWKRYGANWAQIAAPRHFFLHTIESFEILCNKTNLYIDNIIFDSYDHTFLNSEKYAKNISNVDPEWESYKFDEDVEKKLINEVRELNKKNESDQAILVLKLK